MISEALGIKPAYVLMNVLITKFERVKVLHSKTRQKIVSNKSNALSTFVMPKHAIRHVTKDASPENMEMFVTKMI